MRTSHCIGVAAVSLLALVSVAQLQAAPPTEDNAQQQKSGDNWTQARKPDASRDSLSAQVQNVRGDTGKWSEDPHFSQVRPLESKPPKTSLDNWLDSQDGKPLTVAADDHNYLVFRTKQLNDNDRVWVERIERRGNQFTIVAHQAVWKGTYRKNFTYHKLLAVKLGKLPPGRYEAKCVLQPLEFQRFEGEGRARGAWPQETRPGGDPLELRVSFTVSKAS